jgi:hypothetical protein
MRTRRTTRSETSFCSREQQSGTSHRPVHALHSSPQHPCLVSRVSTHSCPAHTHTLWTQMLTSHLRRGTPTFIVLSTCACTPSPTEARAPPPLPRTHTGVCSHVATRSSHPRLLRTHPDQPPRQSGRIAQAIALANGKAVHEKSARINAELAVKAAEQSDSVEHEHDLTPSRVKPISRPTSRSSNDRAESADRADAVDGGVSAAAPMASPRASWTVMDAPPAPTSAGGLRRVDVSMVEAGYLTLSSSLAQTHRVACGCSCRDHRALCGTHTHTHAHTHTHTHTHCHFSPAPQHHHRTTRTHVHAPRIHIALAHSHALPSTCRILTHVCPSACNAHRRENETKAWVSRRTRRVWPPLCSNDQTGE